MKKTSYGIIGLMSGTSIDGLDICYSKYTYNGSWSFEIINAETIPYEENWIITLKNAINLPPIELAHIDVKYTELVASLVLNFISLNKIDNLDAICSHGHTVIHKPNEGITYQIGNLQLLSKITNYTCVCDFRTQDVDLGGQGAPLVPIGDQLLFSQYKYCINLGGFSNISFLQSNNLLAFDICPLNIVLNHYSKKIGHDFDNLGLLSSSGEVLNNLLVKLNSLNYYQIDGPKSLGLEWVVENFYRELDNHDYNPKDILRTVVEHAAIQITKVLDRSGNDQVLITGGGVKNTFFMNRLASYSSSKFILPEPNIIDFKEALIFGFLGILKLRKENNCIKSVTGASKNHSSGKIYNIFK